MGSGLGDPFEGGGFFFFAGELVQDRPIGVQVVVHDPAGPDIAVHEEQDGGEDRDFVGFFHFLGGDHKDGGHQFKADEFHLSPVFIGELIQAGFQGQAGGAAAFIKFHQDRFFRQQDIFIELLLVLDMAEIFRAAAGGGQCGQERQGDNYRKMKTLRHF